MHFVIFKTPRTGSTSLTAALNRTPSVACAGEVLNKCPDDTIAQTHIDGRMAEATATGAIHVGFSLNPVKHGLAPDFYVPPPEPRTSGLIVILLHRKHLGEVALSSWIAKRAGRFPGNRTSRSFAEVERIIDQRPHVPRAELLPLIEMVSARQDRVNDFAKNFATRHNASLTTVTYEGLFEVPRADIERIERLLDVRLARDPLSPSLKVLPPARDWIANYAELEDLLRPRASTRANDQATKEPGTK